MQNPFIKGINIRGKLTGHMHFSSFLSYMQMLGVELRPLSPMCINSEYNNYGWQC